MPKQIGLPAAILGETDILGEAAVQVKSNSPYLRFTAKDEANLSSNSLS